MPFIAVAVMISLFLGGTAAVAQSPVGHAAIDHVSSAWTHVEATVTGHADVQDKTEADTQQTSHANARVRSDANAEAQAIDQAYSDETALHAEGQGHVEVNVF